MGRLWTKVYGFAKDWRNLQRYMVYIHEVKPVTDKTIGPGARLKLRVKFLGRMMDAEWEGTEYIECWLDLQCNTCEENGHQAMAIR